MNHCKNCDRVFGDYNQGECNPNGDFVQIRNKETNWEWKVRCPHCGIITDEEVINGGVVRVCSDKN